MTFKTMAWIRSVRDEDFSECKHMSVKEKIEYTKKLARRFVKYPAVKHAQKQVVCSESKIRYGRKSKAHHGN